jgi:lipopolysaccharide export system protein LptA
LLVSFPNGAGRLLKTLVWPILLLGPMLLLACSRPAAAQDDGAPRQVEILAPSDSLVQTTEGGERVQKLFGNVHLRQGTTLLNADRATRYRGRGEILFTGDVLIIDEGDSLWADRVRYDSREKIGRATGNVRVADGEVLLAGPEGRYYFNEKHAVFPERVMLVDSVRVLKSLSGEYFSREERAEFYRQVRVFSDSTYLEADSVTYRRETEVSEARGHVFIERRGDGAEAEDAPDGAGGTTQRDTTQRDTQSTTTRRVRRPSLLGRPLPVDTTRRALLPDTTARTLLWGEYAYNDPRAKYSRVTGSALLVRLQPPDSSETDASEAALPESRARPSAGQPAEGAPDTLVVRARQLETSRSDTLRRLTATDSVRLWQKDLQAVADSAVYDQLPTRAGAPDAPRRQESRFFGAPISWTPGSTGGAGSSGAQPGSTSSHGAGHSGAVGAQLSGDSLRVTGRGGIVQRLYARGNAFLAQEDSALEGRLQQLKGGRMTGRFARNAAGETALRSLMAAPNAEAIYFRKNDDGTLAGATRASSDSVYFEIQNGELRKIRFLHGVEGLDRIKAEDVPDPFRLDGLVWVPERRPLKADFLGEERVRRRLVRPAPKEPARSVPPPARTPPTRAAGTPDD